MTWSRSINELGEKVSQALREEYKKWIEASEGGLKTLIFYNIKELGYKDSQALREEYKEWLEACEEENKHPHVLYMNQMKPNNEKRSLKKGL